MTSGNRSDEPIARDNDEARERLAGLADAFLLHDRDIHAVCDDSVVRVWRGQPLPVRRSRGYAPFPVRLPFEVAPVLAVGGELKATFCVAEGRDAYLSQHIGDMETVETLAAFERAVDHLLSLFAIAPTMVAIDPHPGYLSSRWARAWAEARGIPSSPCSITTRTRPRSWPSTACPRRVLGVVFDGTGFGTDGTVWGGECFVGGMPASRASLTSPPSGCRPATPTSAMATASPWPTSRRPVSPGTSACPRSRRARRPSGGCSSVASPAA